MEIQRRSMLIKTGASEARYIGSLENKPTDLIPSLPSVMSVSADGDSTNTTTYLTLAFSPNVAGLTAGDISLSGVSGVVKGSLSGSGPYTLGITVLQAGGTLTVAVNKPGYSVASETVTVYYVSSGITLADFVMLYDDPSNKALYSIDNGAFFQECTMPGSAVEWGSISYGEGKGWVALQWGGDVQHTKAAFSVDGINWQDVVMPVSAYWQEVAYSSTLGLFVAISGRYRNSTISAWSSDGVNWTNITSNALPNAPWMDVKWCGDKFLAVAFDGSTRLVCSIDGKSWTTSGINQPSARLWKTVVYGNGTIVLADEGEQKYTYSTNGGSSWSDATGDNDYYVEKSLFAEGRFLLCKPEESSQCGYVYSSNGVSWTNVDMPLMWSGAASTSIGYNNGVFLMASYKYEGKLLKSTNPTSLASSWSDTGLFTGTKTENAIWRIRGREA